jgi:hypothetical protein
MVSSEGACAAYYRYRRIRPEEISIPDQKVEAHEA